MNENLHPVTGDDLTRLFHGTNATIEQIAADGLVPAEGLSNEGMLGDGVTHAIFLTPDADEAGTYGDRVVGVNAVGLDLIIVDGPDGYHYAALETIDVDRVFG